MARVRCRGCEGTYATDQGAVRYFHACPPIVARDPLEGTPRPRARNENVKLTPDGASAGALADGDGTDPVPNGE